MDIQSEMKTMGVAARDAARKLALASTDSKNNALMAMAQNIRSNLDGILQANTTDVENAKAGDLRASFIDRLALNPERVEAMAKGLEDIARLDDPVGATIAEWTQPNGLQFSRVRVPIGVIGIIYESRPNVTADAGALCMKSGNAAILRGGSDSINSSGAIVKCLQGGLVVAGLPKSAIQMVTTTDRAAVGMMLTGLDGNLDLIVPRGGKSLVGRVQDEARVPVFAHLEGLCHVYVDKDADAQMARDIVVNAKMRRTGICGAAETVLIDKAGMEKHLKSITDALIESGCTIRGGEISAAADSRIEKATEEDWVTEYLDTIISMKVVDGVEGAMDHIARYGSQHTDAIVTDNDETAQRFLNEVDSAIVLHNASTQYADGGEFGFGAEIGIATGKMHARGPVGLEQLTSFKYQVRGNGQVRPK
ncbi:Gamma-glutamyl phosphate reductase [hydrothermal vent metagenome]|uniref:glutamate-5-semialdehyde dehydrogenase n=1 Tax=hydrothermal vent metagenome TaxID=652676 RepID=A0A3B0SLA3_9ZZZZ